MTKSGLHVDWKAVIIDHSSPLRSISVSKLVGKRDLNPVESEAGMKKLLGLIPGVALLAAVGYGGKLIEHSIAAYGKTNHIVLPNIEYVLWAIVIGLVIGNLFGGTEKSETRFFRLFNPGVMTYEIFLKVGIMLLGSRFILVDILKLGGISLVMVMIELGMAIIVMTWLGKKFGLPPKLISLLAVGSSICGVSAIIATEGAIDPIRKKPRRPSRSS